MVRLADRWICVWVHGYAGVRLKMPRSFKNKMKNFHFYIYLYIYIYIYTRVESFNIHLQPHSSIVSRRSLPGPRTETRTHAHPRKTLFIALSSPQMSSDLHRFKQQTSFKVKHRKPSTSSLLNFIRHNQISPPPVANGPVHPS